MLLLIVFTCVNVSVLVLRRDRVDHEHFHAPSALPVLGAVTCVALAIQKLVDEPVTVAYAGGLLVLGAALWLLARAIAGPTEEIDPAQLVD